ncbi:calcium/calmodulin-dependent protein kinase type II subunit delta-like isoform X2 [Petromyzon marinus]|nr:calcium/calmodulin-dependent protein kinase type II subunit delta-like isoform X2 [Petromyzon marinus]
MNRKTDGVKKRKSTSVMQLVGSSDISTTGEDADVRVMKRSKTIIGLWNPMGGASQTPANQTAATAVALPSPPASKAEDTNSRKMEVVKVTEELIEAINNGDFEAYRRMCDPCVTSFEPEALGNLVEGVEFYRFFFENVVDSARPARTTLLLHPRVHLLGDDAACVALVSLAQGPAGMSDVPRPSRVEETLLWGRSHDHGRWLLLHAHRSRLAANRM